MKINLASTRLAFFLIALILILIILSAVIPQTDIARGQILDVKESLGSSYVIIEKLKLDEIYTAPYFFILLGLLAVNLIYTNIKRFIRIFKIEKTLIKARHLGSILFHFSLIIVIVGVILNFLYKCEGVFSLTEGQQVHDIANDYFRIFKGPLYKDEFDRFQIKLDNINTVYRVDQSTTNAAVISIRPMKTGADKSAVIKEGQPLEWNDITFHFGSTIGYSPSVNLSDTTGAIVFNSFVRLASRTIDSTLQYYDYFTINDIGLKINIEVLPNEIYSDSILLQILVEKDSEIVYENTVELKQEIDLGDYKLTVPELRRWGYISAVKNPFLNLIFFGFWSALAGMSINLIGRTWSETKKKK